MYTPKIILSGLRWYFVLPFFKKKKGIPFDVLVIFKKITKSSWKALTGLDETR